MKKSNQILVIISHNLYNYIVLHLYGPNLKMMQLPLNSVQHSTTLNVHHVKVDLGIHIDTLRLPCPPIF